MKNVDGYCEFLTRSITLQKTISSSKITSRRQFPLQIPFPRQIPFLLAAISCQIASLFGAISCRIPSLLAHFLSNSNPAGPFLLETLRSGSGIECRAQAATRKPESISIMDVWRLKLATIQTTLVHIQSYRAILLWDCSFQPSLYDPNNPHSSLQAWNFHSLIFSCLIFANRSLSHIEYIQ